MRIRIIAKSVPRFDHADLGAIEGRWTEIDLDALKPGQREALVAYSGRYVDVHPADHGKLEAVGLGMDGERMIDLASPATAAPDAGAPASPPPRRIGKRE